MREIHFEFRLTEIIYYYLSCKNSCWANGYMDTNPCMWTVILVSLSRGENLLPFLSKWRNTMPFHWLIRSDKSLSTTPRSVAGGVKNIRIDGTVATSQLPLIPGIRGTTLATAGIDLPRDPLQGCENNNPTIHPLHSRFV